MATSQPVSYDNLEADQQILALDPRDSIIHFHGIPSDLGNLYGGFDGLGEANQPPHYRDDTDSGISIMEIRNVLLGLYVAYGQRSRDGHFGERVDLFGRIELGERVRYQYEISLDRFLSTIRWDDTEYRDYFGETRLGTTENLLVAGILTYIQIMRDTQGDCPDYLVPIGVSIATGTNSSFYRFLIDRQLARAYDTELRSISWTLSYFGTRRQVDLTDLASRTMLPSPPTSPNLPVSEI